MSRTGLRRRLSIIDDIAMYTLLLVQMLYIFTGNTVHEILGIAFFVCLVVHIILKLPAIKGMLKRKSKPMASRRFSDIVTVLLFISIIVLMLTSMGVSRLIFPWFRALGSVTLHRYMATAVLTLAVIHGGMHGYMRTKKKKRAVVIISLASAAALAIGLFAVPYMNRHLKKVEVDYAQAVNGEKIDVKGNKPLVVYFTRLGNTDFEDDIDAVSGASLLRADGKLTGSNELLADMLTDMLSCEAKAITLTGQKYPSSYAKTISVAGDELDEQARPDIEKIDVSGYDSVILVYPLWWGSIPMPVASFLENSELSGKTVYLVATQGSSGFGSTVKEITKLAKGADVKEVISIYCEDIPKAREQLFEKFKEIYS